MNTPCQSELPEDRPLSPKEKRTVQRHFGDLLYTGYLSDTVIELWEWAALIDPDRTRKKIIREYAD